MQCQWYFTAILCFIALNACGAQQTADKAANAKTKQILTYIAGLPQQGKLLSGQFAGYSPDTFNTNDINEIQRQTSQTPAILGCDYACGWGKKTPPHNIIDYSCNPSLKDHWNKGGLVTVNMHLPNPVTTDGGAYKERLNLNFADLLNTNNPTGQRWRAMMDRIAEGLDDLQRAGATVIYRPLHEMNGDWFYWCDQNPDVFKNVWRDMFNYFTNTKNLHNLIWVYSPDQSRANPSKFYPGDAYVDIVSLDAYSDDPYSMKGYDEMVGLNKVFALAEVGPSTTNGQFDYTRWLGAIESKFPRVAYFFAWNDGWSPIRNQNAYAFFNHRRVINRAQINLAGAGSGGSTAAPATSTPSGTALYNFSNGIGQWKGTSISGGPWRTNEVAVSATDSLKADVQLSSGKQYILFTQEKATIRLAGRKRAIAQARVASWGFSNGGSVSAKLYIKAGSGWTWYDSGSVQLNSGSSTALVLDLSKVPAAQLGDVQEIGVEYTSNTNGGTSAVYLSYITVE